MSHAGVIRGFKSTNPDLSSICDPIGIDGCDGNERAVLACPPAWADHFGVGFRLRQHRRVRRADAGHYSDQRILGPHRRSLRSQVDDDPRPRRFVVDPTGAGAVQRHLGHSDPAFFARRVRRLHRPGTGLWRQHRGPFAAGAVVRHPADLDQCRFVARRRGRRIDPRLRDVLLDQHHRLGTVCGVHRDRRRDLAGRAAGEESPDRRQGNSQPAVQAVCGRARHCCRYSV